MDAKVYEIVDANTKKTIDRISWENLNTDHKDWGYSGGVALRSAWRKEKARRERKSNLIIEPVVAKSFPRIGIADLETLPDEVYVWRLFDQNVSIGQIIRDTCLLSWAGKFLNESEVYSDVLNSVEAQTRKDERIVKSAWNFLSKCDVVVGHNWTNFDGKILNTLFLLYDLPPLHYKIIDTLLIAKMNFRFTSNKLEFINSKLNIRNKISNEGFPLWAACCRGDENALKEMLIYNVGDVHSSESLFYKLRPYVKNLNVSLYNEIEEYQCPVCGNDELTSLGFYFTSNGKYESLRCEKCQGISRKKENLLDKDKRKNILMKI
jgi:DNA polymerase III epsilon subunit-like protein